MNNSFAISYDISDDLHLRITKEKCTRILSTDLFATLNLIQFSHVEQLFVFIDNKLIADIYHPVEGVGGPIEQVSEVRIQQAVRSL